MKLRIPFVYLFVLCNSKVLGGAKGSILLILAVVLLSCMGESL